MLVAGALVALAVFAPQVKLPVPARLLALVGFGLGVVFTLLALPLVPNLYGASGAGYDQFVSEGHGFSYWVVLVLLIAGAIASFLGFQQAGGEFAAAFAGLTGGPAARSPSDPGYGQPAPYGGPGGQAAARRPTATASRPGTVRRPSYAATTQMPAAPPPPNWGSPQSPGQSPQDGQSLQDYGPPPGHGSPASRRRGPASRPPTAVRHRPRRRRLHRRPRRLRRPPPPPPAPPADDESTRFGHPTEYGQPSRYGQPGGEPDPSAAPDEDSESDEDRPYRPPH